MPRYKFIKQHNEYAADEVAELPTGTGEYLIRMGVVMEVKQEKPTEIKEADKASPKKKAAPKNEK